MASAQNFYDSYKHYINSQKHFNSKSLSRSIKMMKEAFDKYSARTKHSILERDTLFIVTFYTSETGQSRNVIWNRSNSLYYEYNYQERLEFKTSASERIKGYKPEFKKWVETADTLSYNRYGRQSSWLDAPWVSFIVAIKQNGHWSFVQSGSYSNNVDRLN